MTNNFFNEYKNIRNTAWHFLVSNHVNYLPVNLEQIAERNNWHLLEYNDHKNLAVALDKFINEKDGWTSFYKNCIFIFYRRSNNLGRQRFTIAHEYGHITLKHYDKIFDKNCEHEANMFAARILMPICVLKECDANTVEKIIQLCQVSYSAACFRLKRLNLLGQRNKFYTHPLERKLLEMFSIFILDNSSEKLN